MLQRPYYLEYIRKALKRSRIVALAGPRQCGKTTLARQLADKNPENYFDLEDPISRARLAAPMLALAALKGLVILDEIQLSPDLYPLLRVLADRIPNPSRFLILGSAYDGSGCYSCTP
jgi:predicted AAA+ superfamily ATPase